METAIRQEARTERANYMCPGMHFGLLIRLSQPWQQDRGVREEAHVRVRAAGWPLRHQPGQDGALLADAGKLRRCMLLGSQ